MKKLKKNREHRLLGRGAVEARLRKIQAYGQTNAQNNRFLITWDPGGLELRFGCGGPPYIQVNSNKTVVEVPTGIASRLTVQAVERFLDDPRPVDGAELLDQLQSRLHAYVHFRDERLYPMLSVWAMGTYLYPMFSHYGYLFFHSRRPRSGKTRVEELLSHLCFQATPPLNGPTAPTIRDTAADGGTVVLDTLERWKSKSPEAYGMAMEFLDAGFRNQAVVAKMVQIRNSWTKLVIPVYAPYILAAIGKGSLADTALDRSFVVEMRRKPITVKTRKYNFFRCDAECRPVRDELYVWALQNAAETSRIYESADLETEMNNLILQDRAADIWQPLLAIARLLGLDGVRKDLTDVAVEMGRDLEAAESARNLAIIGALRAKATEGKVVATTSDVIAHLQKCGVAICDATSLAVQQLALHELLDEWGFQQKSVRLNGQPRRAWELDDARLAELERQLIA